MGSDVPWASTLYTLPYGFKSGMKSGLVSQVGRQSNTKSQKISPKYYAPRRCSPDATYNETRFAPLATERGAEGRTEGQLL